MESSKNKYLHHFLLRIRPNNDKREMITYNKVTIENVLRYSKIMKMAERIVIATIILILNDVFIKNGNKYGEMGS